MVIPPDAYSKVTSKIWNVAAKARAMTSSYGGPSSSGSRRSSARSPRPAGARRSQARALLSAGSAEAARAAPSEVIAVRGREPGARALTATPAGHIALLDAASGSVQERAALVSGAGVAAHVSGAGVAAPVSGAGVARPSARPPRKNRQGRPSLLQHEKGRPEAHELLGGGYMLQHEKGRPEDRSLNWYKGQRTHGEIRESPPDGGQTPLGLFSSCSRSLLRLY